MANLPLCENLESTTVWLTHEISGTAFNSRDFYGPLLDSAGTYLATSEALRNPHSPTTQFLGLTNDQFLFKAKI